eukprot:CCRYP_013936-RA/>CCRYP_013936-RA protein AED:0.11 eAED:0.11 QI:0/-1/0/1/-1/1/1/0/279
MSIENKFRTYLSAFDGTKKDFSNMEHLFEEIYDKDFVLVDDGHVIDREQIKRIHEKAFEHGSTATLLQVSSHFVEDSSFGDMEESTIEFKFRLTNDEWDIVIHNIATVQGNKLIRAKLVEETKPILFINFEAYMNAFDGTSKDIATVTHIFDHLYHDDFVYELDGKSINKHQMKDLHASMFALGSKATCVLFKEVGSGQVEFKFRMVNDKMNVAIHNIATVEDNRLLVAKPIDQGSSESVGKVLGSSELCAAGKIASSTNWTKSWTEIESGDVAIVAPQ